MLPAEIDRINDRILDEWRRVDAELARLQAEIADAPNEARRRARLAELRSTVKGETRGLREKTRAWIQGELPSVFLLGAEEAAVSLGVRAAFSQANREAFSRLALDTHDDLLRATKFVESDAKRWIREQAAARTRFVVGGGQTARQGARDLAKALKPISAIRYADGSLHGMKEYAEVVVRTKTAVAYNSGSLDIYEAADVLFVEVIDGPGCSWYTHDDGPPANGLIVTMDEARTHPIAHPNCRRSFSPRTDLRSPEQAGKATATPRTADGKASAAPRSPESPPSSPRTPRSPRGPRSPRRPRGATVEPTPTPVAPASVPIEAAAPIPTPAAAPIIPVAPPPPVRAPLELTRLTAKVDNQNRRALIQADLDRALQAIEKTHSIPAEARAVPLRTSSPDIPLRGNEGHYARYGPKAEGSGFIPGEPIEIAVKPTAKEPASTLIHEVGHYVDAEAITRAITDPRALEFMGDFIGDKAASELAVRFGRDTADEVLLAVNDWLEAVRRSESYARIGKLRLANTSGAKGFADYLADTQEMFARSYAQWIARTDPKTWTAFSREYLQENGVAERLAGGLVMQWTEADFVEISRALDRLFAVLKWRPL